jgi:alanine-glyoxylate transaminase/serine-glyoxylate transaminase/serine-pyruvate transaminase
MTEAAALDATDVQPVDLGRALGNANGATSSLRADSGRIWVEVLRSLFRPRDRVLVATSGRDSGQLAQLAQRVGLDVVICDAPWGEGAPLAAVSHLLWWDPTIQAVLICQEESSSGVRNDVRGVRRVMDETGSRARLLVDTTLWGSVGFRQAEWAVDAVVCSSAELGVASTPMSLLGTAPSIQLPAPLAPLLEDPQAAEVQDHLKQCLALSRPSQHRLAEGVRRGLAAMGLQICSSKPEWASDVFTACVLPDAADGAEVIRLAGEIGGPGWTSGFDGPLPSQVARLDHRHLTTEGACAVAVVAMEAALLHAGAWIHCGDGPAAMRSWFRSAAPIPAPVPAPIPAPHASGVA